MSCKSKSAMAAAQAAEKVLEQGSNAFDEAISHVTPLAKQASRQVADLSQQALNVGKHAAESVGPAIEDARERLAPKVEEVVERIQPTVAHAYETVSDKVQHDVYPKLQELWEQAQESPSLTEASKRGRSTLAALRGELQLPESVELPERVELPEAIVKPRKRRLIPRLFAVIGIAAVVGAIVVAVRTVLGSRDDGWSPQQPTPPREESEDSWGTSPFADEAAMQDVIAEEAMIAEGGPAEPEPELAEAEPTEPKPAEATHDYGEGAYVGEQPPEGFTIKGNKRSMKFHTPEAAGYDRTNADVWFNSEEAAVAAGFTKALR